jgi:hypothetical protein
MPRKHTASFILELPMKTAPADERACAIILDAGRNIGNAMLGEGLHRLDLMRESRAYRAARNMSRGEPRSPERKAGANEFERLFEAFGFTGHALKFARACQDKCSIRDRLPGHVAQTVATRTKFSAAGGELIEFGTRNTCQFCHLHGTYTRKPRSQRYHRFPDGTRVDLYSAFLARFVLDNRLDAIQAAKAWRGALAFLRVASNGFEPASGKGFAVPHVTLGVRAGRPKKYHANHREAGDDVGLAVLPVSRAPESGEAPRGHYGQAAEHASPSLQRGEASHP